MSQCVSNEEGMTHVINILKAENRKLYVRNHSFLNFPTYKIYIPGMSEIYLRTASDITYKYNIARVAAYLLNITKCNDLELHQLAHQIIETINNGESIILGKNVIFKSMSIYLNEDSDLLNFDLRLLLSVIFYKLENHKIALKYMEEFLADKKESNYDNIPYYMAICSFLNYKIEKYGISEIQTKLVNIYGENIANEVIEDMTDTEALFDGIGLPSCPDCHNCAVNPHCKFTNWNAQNDNLNKAIDNFYNQKNITNAFCHFQSKSTNIVSEVIT